MLASLDEAPALRSSHLLSSKARTRDWHEEAGAELTLWTSGVRSHLPMTTVEQAERWT